MLKGIFGKIFVLVVGVSLIVSVFILVVTIEERTKSTEETLVQENKLLAKIASKNIESGYYANILPLETLKLISDSKNILFVWVVKPNGEVYLADDPQMLGKIINDPTVGTERVEVRDSVYSKDGKKIKLIIQPIGIKEEGKLWSFFLGVSLEEIAAAKREVMFTSINLFVAVFIFAVFISFYLARGVTSPLELLRKGTEIIGKGNLAYQIEIKTGDEIEELAESFNQMTKNLGQSRTALEKAKRKAEEEKEKTLAIITNFADGLLVFDEGKKLSLVNPQVEKFFNISSEKVVGKSISELNGVLNLLPLISILEKEVKGIFRKELQLKENLILEVSTIPIVGYKEGLGTLVILHDVTREKMIEKTKTEFVSLSAHQLRTPLSAIKWTLKMLLDGDLGKITEEQKDFLKKTYKSNEKMISLINDLLNVVRIEEGRYLYNPVPADLERIVQSVIESYKEEVKKKRIKFEFKKPEKKLPKIKVDAEKIGLAIDNLIDNGIRYTPAGGEVTVSLKHGKKEIEFSIKDTGVGISSEEQARIFTKFFRGISAVRMETEGSGLGLFITKNIIEAHKGKIWFESEEGKGTTFWFTLPLK